jgi:hypothetical protein
MWEVPSRQNSPNRCDWQRRGTGAGSSPPLPPAGWECGGRWPKGSSVHVSVGAQEPRRSGSQTVSLHAVLSDVERAPQCPDMHLTPPIAKTGHFSIGGPQRHGNHVLQLLEGAAEGFPDLDPVGSGQEDGLVRVHAGHTADAGERVAAGLDEFGDPLAGQEVIMTKTSLAPVARSMAPPTAGIASGAPVCQLARSPVAETWKAPSTQMSRCPSRMIAKESAWWK